MNKKMIKGMAWLLALLLSLSLAFTGCDIDLGNSLPDDNGKGSGATDRIPDKGTENGTESEEETEESKETQPTDSGDTAEVGEQREAEKALGVPKFSGTPYAALNDNVPAFDEDEITTQSYEFYSALDNLGRCGYTEACIGKDIMPTEDRESISSVKPSGWVNNKYDTDLVDGGYIYNRCHLIGFQLTGENANKKNLITGTRYMNVDGMLPFENMVADYVKETGNHVMYRVTPIYDGNDLVACGVQIEAYSVEDEGDGISFNVYVYNVQPGIVINYATGENWLSDDAPDITEKPTDAVSSEKTYVLNTNTKKIHKEDCRYVDDISEANYQEYTGNMNDLLSDGYTTCGTCKPAA